jgi:hypothetical protein
LGLWLRLTNSGTKYSQIVENILPTPGEAKAKAMPGRLYIHTKINKKKTFVSYLNSSRKGNPRGMQICVWTHQGLTKWKTTSETKCKTTSKTNVRRPQKKMEDNPKKIMENNIKKKW